MYSSDALQKAVTALYANILVILGFALPLSEVIAVNISEGKGDIYEVKDTFMGVKTTFMSVRTTFMRLMTTFMSVWTTFMGIMMTCTRLRPSLWG